MSGYVAGLCWKASFGCPTAKAERGRLSPAQRDIHERLTVAGGTVAVAYGLDAALAQLVAWGVFK